MSSDSVDTYHTKSKQLILTLLSFVIVAFGQPAWSVICSFLAALIGYGLFFWVILSYPKNIVRFWMGTAWFAAIQLVQLSWFISHPFLYIYIVYFLLAFLCGMQFGLICIFINSQQIFKIRRMAAVAALWVLMEWARLFILSGFSWNPSGLALTANIYSLQMASLWGVFGLTFWVMFVNLLAVRAWLLAKLSSIALWFVMASFPFIYGFSHLIFHDSYLANTTKDPLFRTVLVQPAFGVEEIMVFRDAQQMIQYVMDEWHQILDITKKHLGKPIDLIALPEFVVPYGTYSFLFPHEKVLEIFRKTLGAESLQKLPKLGDPFAHAYPTPKGDVWLVNNAYWLQGMANVFNAEVVAGLEDAEDIFGEREYYSAAQHFQPLVKDSTSVTINRYEKRVLVPMGEYIPFEICRNLAASYGIQSSFKMGKEAKVFAHQRVPLGMSICYEETFGHIMRENRIHGAEMLVNLTNDGWYPDSRLPQQHLDHARLRTVEMGIPLVRACNSGITCGIDSLGRTVAILGGEDPHAQQNHAGALYAELPIYSYKTLYTKFGDSVIIGFSLLMVVLFLRFKE